MTSVASSSLRLRSQPTWVICSFCWNFGKGVVISSQMLGDQQIIFFKTGSYRDEPM